MTFVAVVHVFLDAQFLQGQHTADTEQDLLFQTVFPVTAIELVSDGAVELAVHLVVGVQQVEGHTAYVHAPYVRMHEVVQIGHVYHKLVSVFVQHAVEGQLSEVLSLIVGNLLSVHREGLREVAVKVYVAVGSLFQIITGQYAQTTGIYLEYLVQTIFHTEIGNGRTFLVRLYIHVCLELGIHGIHSLQNDFVACKGFEFRIAHSFQQKNRIMADFFPQSRVKVSEQLGGFIVPRPPNVTRQF